MIVVSIICWRGVEFTCLSSGRFVNVLDIFISSLRKRDVLNVRTALSYLGLTDSRSQS